MSGLIKIVKLADALVQLCMLPQIKCFHTDGVRTSIVLLKELNTQFCPIRPQERHILLCTEEVEV